MITNIFHSIILGSIQGIAEFLPISSSAHLVIIPYLFNWNYQGLKIDVALHFGTVIAIMAFFYKDWLVIFKNGFSKNRDQKDSRSNGLPNNFLWQAVLATIPAGIAGILLNDLVESKLHSPVLLAINLAVFGIILWLVDLKTKKNKVLSSVNYWNAFIIGFSQSLALIPGVSRSGITMLTSRSLGLDRESAARYSFLIGTPAMVGAFLLEARKLTSSDLSISFFVGIFVSAIAGFLAIKFLLDYLGKSDFKIFAIYRIVIAAILISVFLFR